MPWTDLLNQVLSIVLPAAATLLAAWFAVLGNKIKKSYENKVNTETKKEIVQSTVAYVQQVFETLDGPEKLQKAIEQASLVLTEKGITVSEAELNMLIESAVYGLKQGLTSEKLPLLEETTGAQVEEAE